MSFFPGLPDLPALLQGQFSPTALLVGDIAQAVLGFALQEWGIYLGVIPIVIADNVVSVEFKKTWRISDYPIENGAFSSYNKVEIPYDAKVTLSKGGSLAERALFLENIQLVAESMALYNVVTPEHTYFNANITHYDYKRTASKGLGLITVDVWLEEIRNVPTASFTKTAQPSGAAQQDGGNVQANTFGGIE